MNEGTSAPPAASKPVEHASPSSTGAEPAEAAAPPEPTRAAFAGPGRDTRIDFIRGWVMLVLIVVHTEFFSLWNLLVWERVGMISGGEGFVILAGVVLGMVSRQRIMRRGWADASKRLLDRAFQLYRVHFTLILLVGLLALVSASAFAELSSFTDRGSKNVYPLYPPKANVFLWLGSIVTLKMGPHQVQILGLYVVLIAVCPLLIIAIDKGRARALLGLSWILYFSNMVSPKMPTGAQFEYGFPLLAWQLLFVHGLVVGHYFNEIQAWFRTRAGTVMLVLCIAIAAFFFVVVQGTSNSLLPDWARFDLWPDFYRKVRSYADKNTLGPLRLLNYAAFLVTIYAILTRWWPFFQRTLGWFLVPIGQATLYVFILHIFAVQACAWIVPFGFDHSAPIWLTTLLHTGELAILWLAVHHKFLFRWIPR
jgi:hypothetical protein